MQAGNILIDHQGQVILADMGIATAMTRSHRLHEGGALDGQPQVRPPPCIEACHNTCTLAGSTFAACPCSINSPKPSWDEASSTACAACNECRRHGGVPVTHHICRHALLDGA